MKHYIFKRSPVKCLIVFSVPQGRRRTWQLCQEIMMFPGSPASIYNIERHEVAHWLRHYRSTPKTHERIIL